MSERVTRTQPTLSERQRQILVFVAEGLTNKAIAQKCGIAEQTVKRHVSALLLAFAVPNRAALVRAAVRSGQIKA